MRQFTKKFLLTAVSLLLVVVCLSLLGCQSNVQANKRRHINSINHRGYGDAPENTLLAFRLSKENGFDFVECDVNFTKDNHPVLLHDSSVNRTSNGRGKISDLTLEQVRQLDFGSWKSKSYAGERIPTFEEFIDLCVEIGLYPYIEIKDGVTTEQTRLLLEIVDKADIPVTWISFDRDIITYISNERPGCRVGLLTYLVTADNLQYISELTNLVNVFIDANYTTLNQVQIQLCKKYKIPLEVWTVNSREVVANIDPYISGITSDYINAQEVFNNV